MPTLYCTTHRIATSIVLAFKKSRSARCAGASAFLQVRILPQCALLLPQTQAVGDHGYELGIRRLALDVRHGVAEKLLQNLNVAPVPCDLDRMADRTLHTGGRRVEFEGKCRTQKRKISRKICWINTANQWMQLICALIIAKLKV